MKIYFSSEIFDVYINVSVILSKLPFDPDYISSEELKRAVREAVSFFLLSH